ncbi:hypothetical protein ACGFYV_23705 [Streptomyces sp. NPDC048297]|uniref:hypothetical protein n=1 Tax=Streptomyces sp. NPDC048297 TaxID=3365531 RepID=UPI00371E8185
MRKIIGTVASAGLLAVVAAGGAYADTCPASPSRLVGKWAGTVTHGGTTGDIDLIFTPAGKACLLTSAGVSEGTWKYTATTGNYTYKITEALIDGTGAQAGWIYINQATSGAVTSTFTSSGTSEVYDIAGNYQFSQVADVDVHRVAGAASC